MFFSNASGQPFKGCGSVMPNALFTLRLGISYVTWNTFSSWQWITGTYWKSFLKKTYNPPTHTLARSLTFPSFYFLDCFPSCTLWLHCSCISPSIQSDGKQMLIQQLFKYSDTIKATITCEGWVVTYSVLWQERNIFLAREFTRELKTSPIFWFWRRVGKDFIWLSCFLSLLISQP